MLSVLKDFVGNFLPQNFLPQNFGEMDPIWLTIPETNIAPENKPSQKETSIPTIHFQVLC